MTFGDLLGMEGQAIEYYEIKGYSVKVKKAKIGIRNDYGSTRKRIDLYLIDKLGRNQYYGHTIYFGGDYYNEGVDVYKSTKYRLGCSLMIYLDKEEAYKSLIEKLRKQRQEINKKMLNAQIELYSKKMDIQ